MDNGYKKILFTITSLVAIIGYGYFVYAAAPNGGYAAGQTLDPDCAPGDTDCIVALSGGGSVTADNGLTVTGSNVQLGGTLTGNTIIDADGHIFAVGTNINGGLDATGIQLLSGSGVSTAQMSGGSASANSSVTIGVYSFGSAAYGNINYTNNTNNNTADIGVADSAVNLNVQDAVQNESYSFSLSDTNISGSLKQNGWGPDQGIGFLINQNGFQIRGSDPVNGYNAIFATYDPGVGGVRENVFLGNNGNWQWTQYLSTRDDSASTPVNFLYTDGGGNVLSAPLNTTAWLLTGNSGTTAGTNFIGTTDAQDLVFKVNGSEVGRFFENNNGVKFVNPGGDASGQYSFAINDSNAVGNYSFSSGNSVSSGDYGSSFGIGVVSESYAEQALGAYNTSYLPSSTSIWAQTDRLLSVGNGVDGVSNHNAYTLWKDGSFAYNDDNFQNDNSGTEQNMFYFNYGNHDGLGVAQTNKSVRLGSACDDIWDVNSGNVGDRSIAIGFALSGCAADGPTASGNNSLAIGRSTIASNQDALAIGTNAQATGEQSVAIGASSFAQGRYSIVLGSSITSSGEGSIGIGGYHTSSGHYSTAIGRANIAEGDFSTVLGTENFARSYAETTLGIFNTDYTAIDATVFESTDRLFSVGNGTGIGARSDAFTILKNGFTGIGYDNFETTALTALLQVNGDIQQTGAISCSLSADSDGMIICTPSDENLKTNINNLTYGLDTLSTLRPVSYTFKDVKYGTGNQIGFIAQELEQIIPEVVTNGPDYKSVNYGLLSSVIVKSIQEMNLKITDIDNMETPNTWRDALIAWFESTTNGIRKLFVGEVHTDTLCIGQTCVTESQLQQLLQNSPQVIYSTPDDNPPTEPDPETSDEPPVPELESNPGINEESPAPDVTDNAPTE